MKYIKETNLTDFVHKSMQIHLCVSNHKSGLIFGPSCMMYVALFLPIKSTTMYFSWFASFSVFKTVTRIILYVVRIFTSGPTWGNKRSVRMIYMGICCTFSAFFYNKILLHVGD